jgi:hypothetical protein
MLASERRPPLPAAGVRPHRHENGSPTGPIPVSRTRRRRDWWATGALPTPTLSRRCDSWSRDHFHDLGSVAVQARPREYARPMSSAAEPRLGESVSSQVDAPSTNAMGQRWNSLARPSSVRKWTRRRGEIGCVSCDTLGEPQFVDVAGEERRRSWTWPARPDPSRNSLSDCRRPTTSDGIRDRLCEVHAPARLMQERCRAIAHQWSRF